MDGLIKFDQARGFRGPVDARSTSRRATGAWRSARCRRWPTCRNGGSRSCSAAATARRRDRPAAGREPGTGEARRPSARPASIPLDEMKWAAAEGASLEAGRRGLRVEQVGERPGVWKLQQVPEIEGALVAMDPLYRPRARHGRRLLLRREPVQPRHPGAAAAGLVVQAVRLRGGARQRLHAVLGGARRADRDRSGLGQPIWRPENYAQRILRSVDAADRHREVAQRHDRAPRAGHGHAARRRICAGGSASTTICRRSCRCRSAPARRRCSAWSPPMRSSPMAAARSARR